MRLVTPSVLLMWFVLNSFVIHRITRLISKDQITEPWRRTLRNKYHGWVVDLIHCTWCVSVWVGALVIVPTLLCPAEWRWIAIAIAAMSGAGVIADRGER